MKEGSWLLIFIALWLVMQIWVLPKFGVST